MSNESVMIILDQIKSAFDTTMFPAILADREGFDLGELEKAKQKRVDLRVPKMLARSGKGGKGHEEWRNVTLFDHATSVAMMAAYFAAKDSMDQGGYDLSDARNSASFAFAAGILHDLDKLENTSAHGITKEIIHKYFDLYRVEDFFKEMEVKCSPDEFASALVHVENRTANTIAGSQNSYLIGIASTYLRLADQLDSKWLHGQPSKGAKSVTKFWNNIVEGHSSILTSKSFSKVRMLMVNDVHHPMLLNVFSLFIKDACEDIFGFSPLFHIDSDETLISLLPEEHWEEIVDQAAKKLAGKIPFNFQIQISNAGIPKATGSKPVGMEEIQTYIRDSLMLADSGIKRLFLISTTKWNQISEDFKELARKAQVPLINNLDDIVKKASGKTLPILYMPDDNTSDEVKEILSSLLLTVFSIGVEEQTKDPAFKRISRESQLLFLLGDSLPSTLTKCEDTLIRQAAIALATVIKSKESSEFNEQIFGDNGYFDQWFRSGAILKDMPDKGAPVREAVYDHFLTRASGNTIRQEYTDKSCFITGEPLSELSMPISAEDSLYGIKTSAFSNRMGTSESKFGDKAETRLSFVSYAEYKLKAAVNARFRMNALSLPVRVCSPVKAGISSLSLTSKIDELEFSLADIARGDPSKKHYVAGESYSRRVHMGRFESLPESFGSRDSGWGRVTFFKLAMQASQRLGQAVHIFSGLTTPRLDFFYADCFDKELVELLGGNGFRLEELDEKIGLLKILEDMSSSRKKGGIAMPDIAKAFCNPKTRISAGCLAWSVASAKNSAGKNEHPQLAANLSNIINRELNKMEQNTTNAVVKLGRLAAAIQKKPGLDEGASSERFLFHLALDHLILAQSRGIKDRDYLIGSICGEIKIQADRRASSAKGFWSGSQYRKDGQTQEDTILEFTECFIDEYWNGLCRGKMPNAKIIRADSATYRYVFTHRASIPKKITVENTDLTLTQQN